MPPPPLPPELMHAIEELYRVFEKYPRRRAWHCTCGPCNDQLRNDSISGTPLRELNDKAVFDRLMAYPCQLWGAVEDMKHLLPRALELLVADSARGLDFRTAGKALAFGKLGEWPDEEQSAISSFLAETALADAGDEGGTPIEDVLLMMAEAGLEMLPVLDKWMKKLDGPAGDELASFTWRFVGRLLRGEKVARGWKHETVRKAKSEVLDWFFSPGLEKAMEDVVLTTKSGDRGQRLSEVLEFVASGRKRARSLIDAATIVREGD